MKIALLTIVIAAAAFGLNYLFPVLPWYMPFILAFLAGIYSGRMKTKAFLAGFFGLAIFWGILLIASHLKSDGLVTERICALLSENIGTAVSPILLIAINILLGALLGGLAALSGKGLAGPSKGNNRYGRHNNRNKSNYKLKLN